MAASKHNYIYIIFKRNIKDKEGSEDIIKIFSDKDKATIYATEQYKDLTCLSNTSDMLRFSNSTYFISIEQYYIENNI